MTLVKLATEFRPFEIDGESSVQPLSVLDLSEGTLSSLEQSFVGKIIHGLPILLRDFVLPLLFVFLQSKKRTC